MTSSNHAITNVLKINISLYLKNVTHIKPFLRELHRFPVRKRKLSVMVYKCLDWLHPTCLLTVSL